MVAPVDPSVARARWAAYVDRAMRQARQNGLTNRKIAALTGLSTGTLHRWRTADGIELPEIEKVRVFCQVVEADLNEALNALGLTDSPPAPTPEPPLPRDVQIILRRLADPHTPDAEREFIRRSLEMLADRIGAEGRRSERSTS